MSMRSAVRALGKSPGNVSPLFEKLRPTHYFYPMITSPLRHRSAAGRARAAFTLIELLTVIAIIGILAAIIIPTVTSVRERANSIKCAVKLRGWASAVINYANDRKGAYDIIGVDENGKTVIWCQISTSGSGGLYLPYLEANKSTNYTINHWLECESAQGKEEYAAASAGGANTPAYTAYVLSAPWTYVGGVAKTITAATGASTISVPLSKAAQPSRTILMIERPYIAGGSGQDTGGNATIDKDKTLVTIYQGHTRHNKNIQTVFMDGHSKSLKAEDLTTGSGRGAAFDNTLLQLY
jgi:prepilin-type N-terminal cleavage/methylation domain-containing protein